MLAVVALLYFVIDLFAGGESGVTGEAFIMNKECEEFLARGQVTLSAVKRSPELFRRITLLEADIPGRNPFVRDWLRNKKPVDDAPQKNKANLSVRYTGYIESAGTCWLMINGMEYSVNQVIDGTNLSIKEASKEYIVLEPIDSNGSDTNVLIVKKEIEDDRSI